MYMLENAEFIVEKIIENGDERADTSLDLAQAIAAIALAKELERIATALEKLTQCVSSEGNFYVKNPD